MNTHETLILVGVIVATVWIANDAGHPDYEKSKEIAGSDAVIRPLTLGDVNYLKVDRLNNNLARGIANYVKPEDFLILSGAQVVSAMAIVLWILQHGQCQCLIWHARQRRYSLAHIKKDNLERLLEIEVSGINQYE